MAIKELLFGALEAIPETMVRADAKPIDPRHMTNMNMGKSLTRLPITKTVEKKANNGHANHEYE